MIGPKASIVRPDENPPDSKLRVRMRLDSDILDHFRAKGDDWEDRLNAVLRKQVESEKKRARK